MRQNITRIVEGWCVRAQELSDGRRQVVALLAPGDTLLGKDNPAGRLPLIALTRTAVECLPPSREAIGAVSEFGAVVAQASRAGLRSARERVAHLFCELAERAPRPARGEVADFAFPLTQEQIGEVLGLSLVHVNRTLQDLRSEGLLTFRAGRAVLLQPTRAAKLAGYQPH